MASKKAKTPFSSDMVVIAVKSATLRVHKDFVEPMPKLWALFEPREGSTPSTRSSGCCLQADMKNLSLDVGHVLVQWLYSGTYQLPTRETRPRPSVALKIAFGAYSVARQYDLAGLETLAKEQIRLHGTRSSVSSFVRVAHEAYPTTKRGDDWLRGFVTSLMKAAIEDDLALLDDELEPDEQVEYTPVAELIVCGWLDACREIVAERVSRALPMPGGDEPTATVEPESPESESGLLPTPTTGDKSQASSDQPRAVHLNDYQEPEAVEEPQAPPVAHHELEPAEEAPLEFVEESELEPGEEPQVIPAEEPALELVEEPEFEPVEQPPQEPQPYPEPEATVLDEIDEWAPPSKKSKKSKEKQKSGRITEKTEPPAAPEPEPEPVPEPEPEPEAIAGAPAPDEVDEWAPLSKKSKKDKKKKKSKAIAEETEPPAEPEPEPVPEPEAIAEAPIPDEVDEWAAPNKKKKKKKAASVDSWADLNDEPRETEEPEEAAVTVVTEVEAEKDAWSFWGVKRSPRQSLS
ncbi:hypothetical protein QBC34DRAFT_498387 [Podospora aff. communis PSN243]|uniref:BTB domain-containing protein n=1 Tax=Podospora aff. communis PSN243 TaxID=3040156 RepID=A0AAV9G9Y9_9PEZI|nr:hypothetical protein QBC34DRAFT_498387 [Podospora aff. communis PSN243]